MTTATDGENMIHPESPSPFLSPQTAAQHERRKGKWIMKLLAAHYIYVTITRADGKVPRNAGVCSAVMDAVMSMKTLGRLAVHWGVANMSSLDAVVDDSQWVPEELYEVAKAHVYHYTTNHTFDATLAEVLSPYFDKCFQKTTKASALGEKSVCSEAVQRDIAWDAVLQDVLKELRQVTATTQSRPEGWVSVKAVIERVSNKHQGVVEVAYGHFITKMMEYDGMLKLQELKGGDGTLYLRASYCHKDPSVATSVLASHVRIGAAGSIVPTKKQPLSAQLYEFVESTVKPDYTFRTKYNKVKMVPFRPLILFPEVRAECILRRSRSDEGFARANNVKQDSAFLPCTSDALTNLIIVDWAAGATPTSHPASDKLEEVGQQYHVTLPHSLDEIEGVVTMRPTTMRCTALIPISFGEPVMHLFPILSLSRPLVLGGYKNKGTFSHALASTNRAVAAAGGATSPAGGTSSGAVIISHSDDGASEMRSLTPSLLPELEMAAAACTPSVTSLLPTASSVGGAVTKNNQAVLLAPHVASVDQWLSAGDGASPSLAIPIDGDKRTANMLKGLVAPLVDRYNKDNPSTIVLLFDSFSRAEMMRIIDPSLATTTTGALPSVGLHRAPSATACAMALMTSVLGVTEPSQCPPDLLELLFSVLHPTRYELLEFLGDAVGDFIAARRQWDSSALTSASPALGVPSGDAATSTALKEAAAAIGKEVSRTTNNVVLADRLPAIFKEYLRWVMGRTGTKHFADAYEAIVGAFYVYGYTSYNKTADSNAISGVTCAIDAGVAMAARYLTIGVGGN